jgi:hypothetical protein
MRGEMFNGMNRLEKPMMWYSRSVAAVTNAIAPLPELAAATFDSIKVRIVTLPFLTALSRQVSFVWNRKTAELRSAIAKYSRLLPAMFRIESR